MICDISFCFCAILCFFAQIFSCVKARYFSRNKKISAQTGYEGGTSSPVRPGTNMAGGQRDKKRTPEGVRFFAM